MCLFLFFFFPSLTCCENTHSKINSQSRLFSSQCPGISSLQAHGGKESCHPPLQISLCKASKLEKKDWQGLGLSNEYSLSSANAFPCVPRSFHIRIKEQIIRRNSKVGRSVTVQSSLAQAGRYSVGHPVLSIHLESRKGEQWYAIQGKCSVISWEHLQPDFQK